MCTLKRKQAQQILTLKFTVNTGGRMTRWFRSLVQNLHPGTIYNKICSQEFKYGSPPYVWLITFPLKFFFCSATPQPCHVWSHLVCHIPFGIFICSFIVSTKSIQLLNPQKSDFFSCSIFYLCGCHPV